MSNDSDEPKGLSPLAIIALSCVALPMVFSMSSSSSRTVNGVVVEASYFDPVAVFAGAAGLLFAILLGAIGRGGRLGRWVMALIIMAVGARHVMHGLGMELIPGLGTPHPVVASQGGTPAAPSCDADSPQGCAALCDKGDADACDELGMAWALGHGGLERDLIKAEPLFVKACELKSASGCFNVGVLFRDGDVTTVDRARAVELTRAGCTLKQPACCNFAGVFLADGDGVSSDPAALALFEQACTLKEEHGCANAALAYRDGMFGAAIDLDKAIELYGKACDLREGDACNNLGALLDDEDRTREERERADVLFVKACELKSAMGCSNLGHRLLKKAPSKAVDPLDVACTGQRGRACEELGVLLYEGAEGVEKDLAHARRVFATGCEAGHANSCTNEGIMLAGGEGGAVDADSAVEFFRKACDLKDEKGCAKLGAALAATDPAAAKPLLAEGCAEKFGFACEALKKLGKPDKKKGKKK